MPIHYHLRSLHKRHSSLKDNEREKPVRLNFFNLQMRETPRRIIIMHLVRTKNEKEKKMCTCLQQDT
jgi:hypothetical protein